MLEQYIRDLLILIGSPALAIAGVAWVARKWLDVAARRDELEFKHRLDLAALEESSRISAIAERRAEVLSQFYARLALSHRQFQRLLSPIVVGGPEAQDKQWTRACDQANEAEDFYVAHRLYFDEETCKQIDSIFSIIREANIDYGASQDKDFKNRTERWFSASEKLQNEIPPVLHGLAARFRQILKL